MKRTVSRGGMRRAFTLIEVLVVVAIIALLLAILLPSLQAAKDQARASVCASNERQMMFGMAQYTTEHREYFPGPNTTGAGLHRGEAYAGGAAAPVQDWDFISPTMGKQLGFLRQKDEATRLMKLRNILMTDVRCPNNTFRYSALYSGSSLPGLTGGEHPYVTSYMTPAFFHILPNSFNGGQWEVYPGGEAIRPASNYTPRLSRIGTPGQKVYVFEGARYLDTRYGELWLDYSTGTNTSGLVGTPQGNFTSRGPAFVGSSGEPYQRDGIGPTQLYKLVSLRHRLRMNIAFFDGHVQLLNDRQASRLQFFAPSKFVVESQYKIAFNDGIDTPLKWLNGALVP